MRQRWPVLLGALVLVLVASGAWAVRANGLLGGRDHDGPLKIYGSSIEITRSVGDRVTLNDTILVNLSEQAVVLESVEPVAVDGAEVLGMRLHNAHERNLGYEGYPPPDTTAIRGARIPPGAERNLAIGLRSDTAGRTGIRGLRVRYRIGSRRFEELVRARAMLIAVEGSWLAAVDVDVLEDDPDSCYDGVRELEHQLSEPDLPFADRFVLEATLEHYRRAIERARAGCARIP